MKKILLIILFVILVGLVVLTTTKPDRSDHYDAVKMMVAKVADRELHANPLTAEYATIGTVSALEKVDDYLSKNLMVQDHTFYTVGMLRYQEMFFPITIGIFGQVHLTISEEDLKKALKMPEMKEMMKSKSVEDAVRLYMKNRKLYD